MHADRCRLDCCRVARVDGALLPPLVRILRNLQRQKVWWQPRRAIKLNWPLNIVSMKHDACNKTTLSVSLCISIPLNDRVHVCGRLSHFALRLNNLTRVRPRSNTNARTRSTRINGEDAPSPRPLRTGGAKRPHSPSSSATPGLAAAAHAIPRYQPEVAAVFQEDIPGGLLRVNTNAVFTIQCNSNVAHGVIAVTRFRH